MEDPPHTGGFVVIPLVQGPRPAPGEAFAEPGAYLMGLVANPMQKTDWTPDAAFLFNEQAEHVQKHARLQSAPPPDCIYMLT